MIELLIVMAIIAILAGIMSIAIQGFVRDSKLETANKNAQMVFTGFQNMLTQCEIKQNATVFSYDGTSDFNSDLKQVVIGFEVYGANVQSYRIKNVGSGSSTGTGSEKTFGTAYKGDGGKYDDAVANSGFSKLPNEIMDIIDTSFEGSVQVYIDYENYEVKSVIYRPLSNGNAVPIDSDMNGIPDFTCKAYGTGNWYYGLDQIGIQNGKASQKDVEKKQGIICGVYPYQDALL